MKLIILAVTLLATAAPVASAGRAGGRPQLRGFTSAAEALASVRHMQQTVRPDSRAGCPAQHSPAQGRRYPLWPICSLQL
mgnify:CR=1 FL=1